MSLCSPTTTYLPTYLPTCLTAAAGAERAAARGAPHHGRAAVAAAAAAARSPQGQGQGQASAAGGVAGALRGRLSACRRVVSARCALCPIRTPVCRALLSWAIPPSCGVARPTVSARCAYLASHGLKIRTDVFSRGLASVHLPSTPACSRLI